MKPPQIDDYLPTRYLRYIGAAKTFAARSQFYASFPQFVMIATLFYFSSTLAQHYFPSIWAWIAFLALYGAATVLIEYAVVYPSQITFNAGQESRENRNPGYREIMRLHRRLDQLEPKLSDGGQPVVVPQCRRCDAAGVPDGAGETIACPECGNQLFRYY